MRRKINHNCHHHMPWTPFSLRISKVRSKYADIRLPIRTPLSTKALRLGHVNTVKSVAGSTECCTSPLAPIVECGTSSPEMLTLVVSQCEADLSISSYSDSSCAWDQSLSAYYSYA